MLCLGCTHKLSVPYKNVEYSLYAVYMSYMCNQSVMIAICVQFNNTELHTNCSYLVHMSNKRVTELSSYCMRTV